MLRTVTGAWRRATTARNRKHKRAHGWWLGDDRLGGDVHLLTERELRFHRLRTEQPAYQQYID